MSEKFRITPSGDLLLSDNINTRLPNDIDNLLSFFPFDGSTKGASTFNLTDSLKSWVIGNDSPWGSNGSVSKTTIVSEIGPYEKEIPIMQATNTDESSTADGGWTYKSFPVDPTYDYMLGTWIRVTETGNGTFYFGIGGNTVRNISNSELNGNPYTMIKGITTLYNGYSQCEKDGEWLLVVTHVYKYDKSDDVLYENTGIYNKEGIKLCGAYNSGYKWAESTTTISSTRSYLYYSTVIGTQQQWAYPFVFKVDGTEPSVTDIIEGRLNTVNPYNETNTIVNDNGLEICNTTTNIVPESKNRLFDYGNSHGTYNTDNYNSNTYFSIGTVESVVDNVVTMSTVDHEIETYDVFNAQTTGGGITAGHKYFMKKITSNSFTIHEYNSSQDGSQGYIVDGKGFKVHENIWNDVRVSINATDFPTMWKQNAHLPNSSLVKEIIPYGFRGKYPCIRLHSKHKKFEPANSYMAYGVYPPVVLGEIYSFSFWFRIWDKALLGTTIRLSLWTNGNGWSCPSKVINKVGEWILYTGTATAPNDGNTNLYFNYNKKIILDIALLQCEHKPRALYFADGDRTVKPTVNIKTGLYTSDATIIGEFNLYTPFKDSVDGYNFGTGSSASLFSITDNSDLSIYIAYRFYLSGGTSSYPYMDIPTPYSRTHQTYTLDEHKKSYFVFRRTGTTVSIKIYQDGWRSEHTNTINSTMSLDNLNFGDNGLGIIDSRISNVSIYNVYKTNDELDNIINNNLKNDDDTLYLENIKVNKGNNYGRYFPLSENGNSINYDFLPSLATDLVFENDGLWIGNQTINLAHAVYKTFSPWGDNTAGTSDYFNSINIEDTHAVHLKLNSCDGGTQWISSAKFTVKPSTKYTVSSIVKYTSMPSNNLYYIREYQDSTQLSQYGIFASSNKTYLGDGWYQCFSTITTSSDTNGMTFQSYEYVPKEIWMYNIQLEEKPFRSPYTTYSREVSHLTYDNYLLNLNQGGIMISFKMDFNAGNWAGINDDNQYKMIFSLIGGPSEYNVLNIRRHYNNAENNFQLHISNTTSTYVYSFNVVEGWNTIGLFWDKNNSYIKLFLNGSILTSVINVRIPDTYNNSVLRIGQWNGGTWGAMNMFMKDLFIYDTFPTDEIIISDYKEKINIKDKVLNLYGNIKTNQLLE